MIRGVLIVRYPRRQTEEDGPDEETWGEIDVAALPNPGDLIDVVHDGRSQTVVVRHVLHFAVKHPLPDDAWGIRHRRGPFIHIVTDWRRAD